MKYVGIAMVRKAIADYMESEGCNCCQNVDAHRKHKKRLAKLLEVPPYDDNSGWDFGRFRTVPPQPQEKGEER